MPATSPFHPFYQAVASGKQLTPAQACALAALAEDAPPGDIMGFAALARDLAARRFGGRVGLCAIVSAKSGGCSEDCAFCAQSAHYPTAARQHPFLDLDTIRQAARRMGQAGAARFSVVSSGKGISEADFPKLLAAVTAIREQGLVADASCGILDSGQFNALARAGLTTYHHNLETAESFFPSICTTHAYAEDIDALRLARKAGLSLCCGGIFGLGESFAQRAELALTLRELGVTSVPVNFLIPIPGTPLENRPVMDKTEALAVIALLRFVLPQAHIRLCGGREAVFGPKDATLGLAAGASGMMIGDYLTTPGADPDADRRGLAAMGLVPETPESAIIR